MANTIRTTISDGAQVLFSVDFALGFLSREHIYVYTGDDETFETQLAYTWVSNSQIQLDAPENLSVVIKIRRVVPRDTPYNDFEDGAILHERNLDASFAQALMIGQELEDGFMVTDAAVWALKNELNMLQNKITNMADGEDPQDATTLAQVQRLLEQNVVEGPVGPVGDTGATGDTGLNGADGADGAQGSDGKTVTLTTSTQAFKYDEGGFNPSPSSAVVTANALNTTGLVFYEFFVDDVVAQASSVESAFLYVPPADILAQPDKIEVQIREGAATGPIIARDQLTLFGLQKGTNAVTVILSNEAHALPSDGRGVIDYSGSGTDIQVYIGAERAAYDDVFPYDPNSFRVSSALGTNITLGADTTVSTYTRRFEDASASTNRIMAGVFTIVAVDGGLQQTQHVRVQSLNVNADGLDGADAVSGAPLQTITWFSGDNGVTFTPAATTFDHYATFYQSGVQTAQNQVRATLDPVLGTVSMGTVGQTGDDTTVTFAGQNTTLATTTVTHTPSGVSILLRSEVLILGQFADQTLFNSEIARLEAQQDSLVGMVGDLSAATTAIYIQAAEPVAGVGGIPNPIEDFARWYDSDNNNSPHYWNGSAWISLENDLSALNAADIVALTANLAATDAAAVLQASALSTLEINLISTDAFTASLAADVTQLESGLIDAENDLIAQGSAINALDTRTTTSEDEIAVQASELTELTTEVRGVFALQLEDGSALQLEDGSDLLMEGSDSTALIIGAVTDSLSSRITVEGDNIDILQAKVTILEATVDLNNGAVLANSSAIQTLDTQVSITEASTIVNASDITTLRSDLAVAELSIVASADALTALDTRVELTEDDIVLNATKLTELTTELEAEVLASSSARALLDSRITANDSELTVVSSDLVALAADIVSAEGDILANSGATASLGVIVNQQGAELTSQSQNLVALTSSLGATNSNVAANASATSGLSTRVSTAEGQLVVSANDIAVLGTTVGGHTATITQHTNSINGLSAEYSVAIDANGNVSGFRLVGGATSEFSVLANRFKIQDPSAPSGAPLVPFLVSGGIVYMQDVVINGNLLVSGSVGTDSIGTGAVSETVSDSWASVTPTPGWTTVATASIDGGGDSVEVFLSGFVSSYMIGVGGVGSHGGDCIAKIRLRERSTGSDLLNVGRISYSEYQFDSELGGYYSMASSQVSFNGIMGDTPVFEWRSVNPPFISFITPPAGLRSYDVQVWVGGTADGLHISHYGDIILRRLKR